MGKTDLYFPESDLFPKTKTSTGQKRVWVKKTRSECDPESHLIVQLFFYLFAGSWKIVNNLAHLEKNKTPPTVGLKQRIISECL